MNLLPSKLMQDIGGTNQMISMANPGHSLQQDQSENYSVLQSQLNYALSDNLT